MNPIVFVLMQEPESFLKLPLTWEVRSLVALSLRRRLAQWPLVVVRRLLTRDEI